MNRLDGEGANQIYVVSVSVEKDRVKKPCKRG